MKTLTQGVLTLKLFDVWNICVSIFSTFLMSFSNFIFFTHVFDFYSHKFAVAARILLLLKFLEFATFITRRLFLADVAVSLIEMFIFTRIFRLEFSFDFFFFP